MYSENSLSVPDLIVSEYISMETERNRHGIHLIGGYSSFVWPRKKTQKPLNDLFFFLQKVNIW